MKKITISLLIILCALAASFYLEIPIVSTAEAAVSAETVNAPKPVKSPGTKICTGVYELSLYCTTKDAEIYYKAGKDYVLYEKPIKLKKTTTVKCYAIKDNVKSKTVSYKYKLQPKVSVNVGSGRYYSMRNVKLTSEVGGVEFFYTLDGSLPTKSSNKYFEAIEIKNSCTLRILAYKSGWSKRYITKDYTIMGKNESVADDYKGKYLYSTLGYSEKLIYERICIEASKFNSEFDAPDSIADIDKISLYDILQAVMYDNPQLFWLNGIGSIRNGKCYLGFEMEKSEIKKIQKKLEAEAKKILDKAMKKSDIKDRAKVIHDQIIADTSYYLDEWDRTNGSADGPLLYGKARCEGYAKAFAYVAQMAGIDTICIDGFAARGSHLWNMIRLNNKWIHVDVTFDDCYDSTVAGYEYFCIDDSYAGLDHVPNNDILSYPTSIKHNEEKAIIEFNKFMSEIKKNYDKGIMVTQYYSDFKPFGSFLMYTVTNMNYGVCDVGIKNMRPWYMYSSNWIQIELKEDSSMSYYYY